MLKLSPRRSQRSKGFKVKHAVQLFLLLGVGIWLLYQVKHSHDNKAAFNEGTKYGNEVIKLGRKDPNPQVDGTDIQDEQNVEEENEEVTKHEVEESAKHGGSEDEGKGNIDDEIQEVDKEKLENEVGHGEDFVNKEKESEEKIDIESEQRKDKETEEHVDDFVDKEKNSEGGSEQMKDKEPEEHGEDFVDKEKPGEEVNEKETEEGNEERIDKHEGDERNEAESEQRNDTEAVDKHEGDERNEAESDTEVGENESRENIKEEMKDEGEEKEISENKEGTEGKEIKQTMKEENTERGNDDEEKGDQTVELVSSENPVDGGNLDGGVEEIQNMTNGTDELSLVNPGEEGHLESKGSNDPEQGKNGNSTNDDDIYHPNITDGGTVEKNDLASVNSIEEKDTQNSNEHLQGQNNPADSSQQSGIEVSSDSMQTQKEVVEDTVSSSGDASTGDGEPDKSSAVQSTDKVETGMEHNSSINENYEASKMEGGNESLNTDGNAGGGQKELVESFVPLEQRADSSTAHNEADAVQGTNSDVSSGSQEMGGDTVASLTNDESSKPSSGQEEIEESQAMHDSVDVQENESLDSTHASMLEEVKDARTDLTTLPEVGSVGNNDEAAAAEG